MSNIKVNSKWGASLLVHFTKY